jgi:hypothetical protein
MARRWGVLALAVLAFGVGCNKKKAPPPPEIAVVDEAALVQQRAQEARLAEQRNQDEQNRAPVSPAAAPTDDEATKRDKTARQASDQQRAADKLGGQALHAQRQPEEAPHKVLAGHQEIIPLEAVPSGTGRTTLHFRSDAGTAFRLVEAHFVVDGAESPVVIKAAQRGKSYLVSGDVGAGRHTVTAQLTYQGDSHGVFKYMNGYTFKVTSDETLTTTGSQAVNFTIVCKEKTGLNTPLEKRLEITVEGHHPA